MTNPSTAIRCSSRTDGLHPSRTNGLHHRGLQECPPPAICEYMYRVAPRDSSTPEREGKKRRGGAQAAAVAKRKPRPTLSTLPNDGPPALPARFPLRPFVRSTRLRALKMDHSVLFPYRIPVRRSSRHRLPRRHYKTGTPASSLHSFDTLARRAVRRGIR
jgi:hypothetical protein